MWLAFGTVAEERCYGGEGIEKRSSRRRRGSFFIGAVREEDVIADHCALYCGEDDDNNDAFLHSHETNELAHQQEML